MIFRIHHHSVCVCACTSECARVSVSYKMVKVLSCCMHVNVLTLILFSQLILRVGFLGPHIFPACSMCSRSTLLSTSLCSWSCRWRCSACSCRSVKYCLPLGPGWRMSRNYRREREYCFKTPCLSMYCDSTLPFCSSSYIVYICSDIGGGPIGAKNLSRDRVPPWLPHFPCAQP